MLSEEQCSWNLLSVLRCCCWSVFNHTAEFRAPGKKDCTKEEYSSGYRFLRIQELLGMCSLI